MPKKESGASGVLRFQPLGLVPSDGPTSATASMIIDRIVVATMPISRPPRTLRATSTPISSTPMTKTKVGHDAIEPSMPSPTGTVVPAASGMRRTKPASTRPIMAMKAPIPAAMAALSSAGIALKTAVRKPVRANTTMMMPSMTTRPIASGQVTCGAMVTASRLLMPRPAAMANG